MTLPYSSTKVGAQALDEARRILAKFGCQSFGHMVNYEVGELIVQFKHRDIPVVIRASFKGYAVAWLKQNPWSHRMKSTRAQHEQKALEAGNKAVYSIVRDWIKAQVTVIECGILSFEAAFLGQVMLPSGKTAYEQLVYDGQLPSDEHVLQIERNP